MKTIGITGGIASGKSTVARLIGKKYPVISCDAIVHALYAQPEVVMQLVRLFGAEVAPQGVIDRRYLGTLIFANPEAKEILEGYIHPQVIAQVMAEIAEARGSLVFVEAPLLFETHMEYILDKVLVVDCSPERQLQRLMKRRHMSRTAALSRINSQLSRSERNARADYLVANDHNSRCRLRRTVKKLLGEIEHGAERSFSKGI